MRRVFGDAVISLCAVLALLLMLVSVDPRVRYQVSGVWGGSDATPVTSIGQQLGKISTVVLSAARDQGIDNAPLMIFALAATVLVLFMLRT
jgi:hypothetical protein